jgi:hypothetical protein
VTQFAVRYTQPLLGAANSSGFLVAEPGASVLVRRAGVACPVYASRTKTPMSNPVPVGVPPGTAGVDTLGNLMLYLDPGDGYDFVASVDVGGSTQFVTVALPGMSVDRDEPLPPASVTEAMLAFAIATQAELDTEAANRVAGDAATAASSTAHAAALALILGG